MKRTTLISCAVMLIMASSQIVGCGTTNTSNTGSNTNKQPIPYRIQIRQPPKDSVFKISYFYFLNVFTKVDEPTQTPQENRDWEFKTLPFRGELKELWNIDTKSHFLSDMDSDFWAGSDKEGWLIAKTNESQLAILANETLRNFKAQPDIKTDIETLLEIGDQLGLKFQFTPISESYIDPFTGKYLPIPVDREAFCKINNMPGSDIAFLGKYVFKRFEGHLKCFDKMSGYLYWDKDYDSNELRVINDYLYIDEFQYDTDERYITSKINPNNGEIIWKIECDTSILESISCNKELNSYFDSSRYLWLYKKMGIIYDIYRLDPLTLEIYKINIDNIQSACSFKNLICVIDDQNILTLIEPNSGMIRYVTNLDSLIKTYRVINMYPFQEMLLFKLSVDNDKSGQPTEKMIQIDPLNINSYFDLTDLEIKGIGLGTLHNSVYFVNNNAFFGIDEKTGQKSWWIPKSTGIKIIYVCEPRGILAYVEKDGFKGLVCFGQK